MLKKQYLKKCNERTDLFILLPERRRKVQAVTD